MLLEQINRRLAAFEAALPQKKVRAMPSTGTREVPLPGTVKTIGVKVDAETYAMLLAFMERAGIKTVKEGALAAIRLGLRQG